jgi:two-component system, OmpR family, response regulator VicR
MKKHILVVDDNEDLLLVINVVLKAQGYQVVLAHSVQEAQQQIRAQAPDLILLDVFVCDEDGREFCKQLKAEPATRDIKVILMSGDEDNSRVADELADDFLAKPFDFNELVVKIAKQLAVPAIA